MSSVRAISTSGTILAMIVLATILPGCGTDGSDPNAVPPRPELPAYLNTIEAIGIAQEMKRIAETIPPYLEELPGVDGGPPYAVQKIPNVTFRYTEQGGVDLDVYRPITTDNRLRRAVVLYMGGGWITDSDYPTIAVWANYLATRGFVAFNARQRLLTQDGVSLHDVVGDAISAARFVARDGARFGADSNRIAVLGRSSGGQLALLVGMVPDPNVFDPDGAETPYSVKAIVDIFGSTDDSRFFTDDDFTLLPKDQLAAAYGGTPTQVPDAYREMAPMTYVRPGLPPIMVIHGALDTTIPPSHSARLADALDAAGDPVTRVFFPHFGHVIGWGLFNNDGFGQSMLRIIPFLHDVD